MVSGYKNICVLFCYRMAADEWIHNGVSRAPYRLPEYCACWRDEDDSSVNKQTTCGSDVIIELCDFDLSTYTVLQTVQRHGVYSFAYSTVYYEEPLKSFEIRVGRSPSFGLPSVAILACMCRKRRKAIFNIPIPQYVSSSNMNY